MSDLRLRRLSDAEFDEAERLARISGVPLSQCPTCLTKEGTIPGSGGVPQWTNGAYRYRGEELECDCQVQMGLRRHYLLANIPDQYMRLDYADYIGPDEVREAVATYLEKWENFKLHGMGMEFGGKHLGVGKTFNATYVGKELIKRRQKVYFIDFMDVVAAFIDNKDLERKLREVTYLILDDVRVTTFEGQNNLLADKLEMLIRHRTNFNLPTIITTNMTEEELVERYPRTYSLLSAKQWRVDLNGSDARRGRVQLENIELVANGEVRPIT